MESFGLDPQSILVNTSQGKVIDIPMEKHYHRCELMTQYARLRTCSTFLVWYLTAFMQPKTAPSIIILREYLVLHSVPSSWTQWKQFMQGEYTPFQKWSHE